MHCLESAVRVITASHLAEFMLDVVFGKPRILRHNPLIFAKCLYVTVTALYRNSYLQARNRTFDALLLNNGHEKPNV
jgi:hypothetical protein